ncbi:MAG: type II toxin-antitoxin system RelE/ParE family toxin [Deinococcota bacterium]|nr:type II toxin-antitoxin system RelE/ParE family toxin [Deinococcota bacterium]
MTYQLTFIKRADKDLRQLPLEVQARIVVRLKGLRQDLAGDVKKLTNHTPEYRLRVGDYRVLFEVDGDVIVVHRVRHRKDAY